MQNHFLIGQTRSQTFQLDLRDALDVLGFEAVEYHDFINAVDEFRAEILLHFLHHRDLDRVVRRAHIGQARDFVRAEVRGHDDHGIAKIDRAPLTIGHTAIVQYLQ